MPRPLYPRESAGTYCTGDWVGQGAVLDGTENFASTGIRSTDRPASSESLNCLCCPDCRCLTKQAQDKCINLKPDVLQRTVLPKAGLQFVRSQSRSNMLSEVVSSRPAPCNTTKFFLQNHSNSFFTNYSTTRCCRIKDTESVLNYKQESTLPQSYKSRCSPVNVVFWIENFPYRHTVTSPKTSTDLHFHLSTAQCYGVHVTNAFKANLSAVRIDNVRFEAFRSTSLSF